MMTRQKAPSGSSITSRGDVLGDRPLAVITPEEFAQQVSAYL
jgi:hypothetical protein